MMVRLLLGKNKKGNFVMNDDIYDDIKLTKRKTITNGVKYDFYIYDMLSLEKKFSNGKFGKGETVISQLKNYKLQDEESEDMLDVKLKCSKKIDDSLEGFNPEESKKIFNQCLNELEKKGLVKY
tara:strand:+ start:128 stop:499 length:372 start_codon:yes stop_codon:yes gene_type:complete